MSETNIEDIVARAKAAQASYEADGSQIRYDRAAQAAAWAIMEPERNRELAELAVQTTGLGNVPDKITKNHRKTLGVMHDIQDALTFGVMSDDPATGITEIARAKGVVAAIVPSTNPAATPANNIINALKCGNAIVIAPSPKGVACAERLLEYVHAEFAKINEDPNLVQMLPAPGSKEKTQALMEACDMIVATGSQNNVHRAQTAGTPAVAVGAGNVTVIVDETADLTMAVEKIRASKCFDNATSCSSENAIVVVDAVYSDFVAAMARNGGALVEDEAGIIAKLWPDGHLNRSVIAQDADKMIAALELDVPIGTDYIAVPTSGIGPDHPLSGEKLSRVLALYRAPDFDSAVAVTRRIQEHQGAGHSVGLHSTDDSRARVLATAIPTSRVIVNQAHTFATGGSFTNGMPFSLSMGCGTWGGNSVNENVNYRHFMQSTKIVREIPSREPSLEDLCRLLEHGRPMKFDRQTPPAGTVRDWVDSRANEGGTAFVFPETGETLTWPDLQAHAAKIAADLTAQGIAKGESVVVMHPNGLEGVKALFAALYGGFRVTMLNLAAGPDALGYAMAHSEAHVAFVHDAQLESFNQVRPDKLNRFAACGRTTELYDIAPADDALLMYTSGTTGRPKGVVHTQSSLLAGGWTVSVAHELTPQDRGMGVLPFYHINGLCVSVMGSLVSGGSLAMVSRFSASKFWDQAFDAGITWFSVVPTIISHLLHGKSEPEPVLKAQLRFARSASSALAVETQRAFQERFGLAIVESLGLTETAAQCLVNPLDPALHKIGSAGKAIGNEARIANETGKECARGVEGEIQIRGANVMKEYLQNPDATTGTFHADWLRTGDLGRMDEDGYVFVTGRLKELIIKGGENIAPREIDEALYEHPDVVEAAAFARPCDRYGERVEAAVRLSEASTASSADLLALCVERVGQFKAPDAVHILPELPKGPSGKIQRLYLNEMLYEAT